MSEVKKRPFAAFDLDGTLIRWQLYHAMADEMAARGYIQPSIYKAMQDARMAWKKRESGFKDYEMQVINSFDAAIKNISFDQFDSVIEKVFDRYKNQVSTYTRDLITELKSKNYFLFAISGSPVEIVKKIADYYQFDDYAGTVYERSDGKFNGQKKVAAWDKSNILQAFIAKHPVARGRSVAVGDTHSDIAMLELAEQPIAFNPEIELFEHAKKNNWKIVIERKNVVLQLESKGGVYQLAEAN